MTTITIDRALLEQALEHLDEATAYTGSTIWSPSLTQDILNFCVKLRTELAKPVEPSYTATQLAAMVLSDCGISTDHTALHEPVAARITRHEDDLIDRLKKLEKQDPPTPAWHDAPTCAGVWLSKTKDSDVPAVGAWNLPTELIDRPYWSEMLWYGPIPHDDKEKGGAA